MKTLVILLAGMLLLAPAEAAQKRKKPRPHPRPAPRKPAGAETKAATSPLVGAAVLVVTKNGDRISGVLVDLNAFSIRIKADGLESAVALDTVSSLSFGPGGSAAPVHDAPSISPSPDFGRQVDSLLAGFQAMVAAAKSGIDYTEYGRQLSELRPQAERFIARYSPSENIKESRAVALVAGALTDYSWARTVWTLKLGRTSDGTIAEADSPIVVDLLALYPELKSVGASGNRLVADKLIAGLWKKAADKVDRVRGIASSR